MGTHGLFTEEKAGRHTDSERNYGLAMLPTAPMRRSRSLAMIEAEHTAQPLTSLNRTGGEIYDVGRFQQLVSHALMIALHKIMTTVIRKRVAQRTLPDKNQTFEAFTSLSSEQTARRKHCRSARAGDNAQVQRPLVRWRP